MRGIPLLKGKQGVRSCLLLFSFLFSVWRATLPFMPFLVALSCLNIILIILAQTSVLDSKVHLA
ncbi:hypothetical protein CCALI_01315 [Chthonomonas calidirosea T49]|uniref:Uncharacterized protein n=1 Tax=Chthonomonas calidirosea (strain DSM 23976 / ICMP 18418 / T49) TaxID=1303518 RepID=S0EU49_CHTCT|nr:hypothetical protein CCALI_01315 [Chthonomonas calidirosea T49]